MICVSIADLSFERCIEVLKDIDMAELRLDLLDFSIEQTQEIFALPNQLIATHRPTAITEEERLEILITAIEAGAGYVDLEIEADASFKKAIITTCRRENCKVIISYHNYNETPAKNELGKIIGLCFDQGADIAKVACQINTEADAARILSLYDRDDKKLVAIGMGEKGKITRLAAPLLGAPFTFAALPGGKKTAPGQMDEQTLLDIFNLMGASGGQNPFCKKGSGLPKTFGYEILGVTGDPVLHSKSPIIFNTLFDHQDINAVYTRIAANTPEDAMFLFNELNLTGMNVTAPFKYSIMPLLNKIDPAAAKIGGVNTIARKGNLTTGYNTDHIGVTKSLKDHGIDIKNKKCIVLGAGGAGRAAVYGLIKEKADVTVVNRTYEKAEQVAKEFTCAAERIEKLEPLLKNADILISTLSGSIDVIKGEWLSSRLVVFDANYKKSALSEKAKKNGCIVIKGEEWLLNQAIPAYQHFLNTPPTELTKVFSGVQGAAFSKKAPWPPEAKKNIALVGFMGSGKSFIGKKLAQKMGYIFKDLDEEIEKKAGRSIPDIFKLEGEAAFRVREKEILKKELSHSENVVYACGGGIVLDGENRDILKENALVVWLYSSIETSLKRIPKGSRPLLDCENPAEEAQKILVGRLAAYARTADVVVANETEAQNVVEKIYGEIDKTFGN